MIEDLYVAKKNEERKKIIGRKFCVFVVLNSVIL